MPPNLRLYLPAFIILGLVLFNNCQCGGVVGDLCVSGEKRCDGQDVLVCNADQRNFSKRLTCPAGTICEQGTCRRGGLEKTVGPDSGENDQLSLCQSQDPKCEDNKVMICRPDGRGYDVFRECTKNEVCKQGSCHPKCSFGEKKCQEDEVLICRPDGSGFDKLATCPAGQFCEKGSCRPTPPICSPGEKMCQEDEVLICRPDGSGFDKLATCPTGQLCEKGSCVPSSVCTLSELRCQNNDVEICKPDGSGFEKLLSCPEGQTCFNGTCAGMACKSGERRCSGNDVMVCNASRTGFVKEMSCDTTNVLTLSGDGTQGIKDGPAQSAQYTYPKHLAIDQNGSLFLIENDTSFIRQVSQAGVARLYAGSTSKGSRDGPRMTARFQNPQGLAFDALGNLLVMDQQTLRKITPNGTVSTLPRGIPPRAGGPITLDTKGNIFLRGERSIIKIPPGGTPSQYASRSGVVDGLCADPKGNVFIVEWQDNRVRKIAPGGKTSTYIGTGVGGWTDGPANKAQFNWPAGLACDAKGNVFVADRLNNRIRKIAPDGFVTTFAGTGAGGTKDGPKNIAQFASPYQLIIDSRGALYVTSVYGFKIRKVIPAGICKMGACTPGKVCLTGTRKCRGNDVMICRTDRSGYDKLLSCPTGQTCQSGGCL